MVTVYLIDKRSEKVLANEVEIIDSFWSRFRGLMFRRNFKNGEALLFRFSKPKKFGIHTLFVFYPIDLIYLDRDLSVLEIKKGLSPWRTYSPEVRASFLVELPEGKIENCYVEVGDKLKLRGEKGLNTPEK